MSQQNLASYFPPNVRQSAMLTARRHFSILVVCLGLAVAPFAGAVGEPENNPVARGGADSSVQRLIVKFRATASGDRQAQAASSSTESLTKGLARRSDLRLQDSSRLAERLHWMQLDTSASGESQAQVLARLRADPQVEYVQLDRRRYAHAAPNDPLYTNQWFLQSVQPSAVRADQAWDITTGSASIVVAILDTGVRFDHPDLLRAAQGGRLLPGYDFVSNVAAANDGNGRDVDPSDPGDWVDSADQQTTAFQDCEMTSSSWHGTRVAGMIGAQTNNGAGVAGGTWTSPLLPVRVLGKCGGFDADIIPAMRWAAGLPVSGVPNNPYPARIINMSLGAEGVCSNAYRDVIAELASIGVLVVASAGNDTGHAVSEPANCPGALGVAGLRHVGTKVGFSNIGPEIGISAPAGNCGNPSGACLYSLDTTTNLGTTTPQQSGYTNSLNPNLGTSFSAPIVAGVAALVLSVNGQLSAAQTIYRLQQSSTPFPAQSDVQACQNPDATSADQLECNCTTSTCGAGMVNAAAAIVAARQPLVIVSASPTSAAQGQTVSLDGSSSFAANGRTLVSYSWTLVSTDGEAPSIAGNNLANASFIAPAGGTIVVRLTVIDSEGVEDSADVSVTTPAPSQTPPTSNQNDDQGGGSSGGGGGGGGPLLFVDLLLLLALSLKRKLG